MATFTSKVRESIGGRAFRVYEITGHTSTAGAGNVIASAGNIDLNEIEACTVNVMVMSGATYDLAATHDGTDVTMTPVTEVVTGDKFCLTAIGY